MARQHHYQKNKEPPDLDITSFLNLMVVLVPFLLITAVFSRITILQLNLPEGSGSGEASEQKLTIEVIVRKNMIELGDGKQIYGRLKNNAEGEYDIAQLSQILTDYKRKAPDKRDATVLMEADLQYEVLVKIMDAVSTVKLVQDDGTKTEYELFPQISIGDAPAQGKKVSIMPTPISAEVRA